MSKKKIFYFLIGSLVLTLVFILIFTAVNIANYGKIDEKTLRMLLLF